MIALAVQAIFLRFNPSKIYPKSTTILPVLGQIYLKTTTHFGHFGPLELLLVTFQTVDFA